MNWILQFGSFYRIIVPENGLNHSTISYICIFFCFLVALMYHTGADTDSFHFNLTARCTVIDGEISLKSNALDCLWHYTVRTTFGTAFDHGQKWDLNRQVSKNHSVNCDSVQTAFTLRSINYHPAMEWKIRKNPTKISCLCTIMMMCIYSGLECSTKCDNKKISAVVKMKNHHRIKWAFYHELKIVFVSIRRS